MRVSQHTQKKELKKRELKKRSSALADYPNVVDKIEKLLFVQTDGPDVRVRVRVWVRVRVGG